jgi:MFS family permease
MTRIWPIAVGVFMIMLPVTAVVPLLYELTEGRFPGRADLDRHLFMSANMAGSLVMALTAGLWSDRIGARKALIVPGLFAFSLLLFLMYLPFPYPIQLSLRFLEGGAHMAVLVLAMTLVADIAPDNRKGRSLGLVGASMSLGVATGSVLGGRIDPNQATQLFLYGGFLMLALAFVATWVIKDAPIRSAAERLPVMLRLLAQQHKLGIPYLFTFIDRLTVGFIISTVSLYFATVLSLSPAQIGLAMATFLLPFGALTYPAGLLCERVSPIALMSVGSVLYGCYLIALGFGGADQILMIMAFGGVVAALMLAPSIILTSQLAGDEQQATAMGGFHLAGSLGFMLGPMLGVGGMATLKAFGLDPYPGIFVVVGSLEIICVLALLPWLLKVHARRATHQEVLAAQGDQY